MADKSLTVGKGKGAAKAEMAANSKKVLAKMLAESICLCDADGALAALEAGADPLALVGSQTLYALYEDRGSWRAKRPGMGSKMGRVFVEYGICPLSASFDVRQDTELVMGMGVTALAARMGLARKWSKSWEREPIREVEREWARSWARQDQGEARLDPQAWVGVMLEEAGSSLGWGGAMDHLSFAIGELGAVAGPAMWDVISEGALASNGNVSLYCQAMLGDKDLVYFSPEAAKRWVELAISNGNQGALRVVLSKCETTPDRLADATSQHYRFIRTTGRMESPREQAEGKDKGKDKGVNNNVPTLLYALACGERGQEPLACFDLLKGDCGLMAAAKESADPVYLYHLAPRRAAKVYKESPDLFKCGKDGSTYASLRLSHHFDVVDQMSAMAHAGFMSQLFEKNGRGRSAMDYALDRVAGSEAAEALLGKLSAKWEASQLKACVGRRSKPAPESRKMRI